MGNCLSAPGAAAAPEAPASPPVSAVEPQPILAKAPLVSAAPGSLSSKVEVAPASEGDWRQSFSKLNQTETAAVQQTLLKVSELIERFAEGSGEREAPVHALKKALQLVAADCHASYASMSVVSADQASFLVMGAVGSSHEATTLGPPPSIPDQTSSRESVPSRRPRSRVPRGR